jgi:butyryl-CoA dehydrogenase
MLLHSTDYLELFGILVIAWQHLDMAAIARAHPDHATDPFLRGKLLAAEYWIATELPRLATLVDLCRSAEDSYARAEPADF